jgi:hypothetical protein
VLANVPPKLEQFVQALKSDPSNPDIKYVFAALCVASNYIQLDLEDGAIKRFLNSQYE